MLINFIALAVGFLVLAFSAEKFVAGTAFIARNLLIVDSYQWGVYQRARNIL